MLRKFLRSFVAPETPMVEIQKLHLEPGDMLVLSCKTYISSEARSQIEKALKDVLDHAGFHEMKTLVLENGMSLQVLTADRSKTK